MVVSRQTSESGAVAMAVWLVLLAGMSQRVAALGSQKHKTNEPKSQVQPLPPQPPMALKAETAALDFHLSPLRKTGGLAVQIHQSLNDLIRDTHGETILKLRAFVAGAGDARRVQAEVTQIFTERKLPLPVLTVIQVGALGEDAAKVVIEAVVATRHTPNEHGLAFFAGQDGDTLRQSLDRLKASAAAASVSANRMLTVTCFTARLENPAGLRADALASFPQANINLVQTMRDALSDRSSCEAVGQLAQTPGAAAPVVLLKEQRTALVTAPQIVLTGLQLSFGSYLDDAHEAFIRLQHSATALDPLESPIEVNVFSLDLSGGSALRKTTAVPPSIFTVQTVEGLPSVDATAGIEAVMAPGVQTAALQ